MTSPLTRKYALYLLTAGLATAAFSSSCSKEESTEPKVVEPDEYVLKDARYFFTADSRIDTALVKLAGLRVQNPSNTLSSQQVEGGFGELMKTSQFELEPTTSLPKEVELNEFELQVPNTGMVMSYSTTLPQPFLSVLLLKKSLMGLILNTC